MPDSSVRKAADRLAGFAITCEMRNTLEWMEGFSVRLNEYLEAIEKDCRVQTSGHGFGLVHKSAVRKEEESHE